MMPKSLSLPADGIDRLKSACRKELLFRGSSKLVCFLLLHYLPLCIGLDRFHLNVLALAWQMSVLRQVAVSLGNKWFCLWRAVLKDRLRPCPHSKRLASAAGPLAMTSKRGLRPSSEGSLRSCAQSSLWRLRAWSIFGKCASAVSQHRLWIIVTVRVGRLILKWAIHNLDSHFRVDFIFFKNLRVCWEDLISFCCQPLLISRLWAGSKIDCGLVWNSGYHLAWSLHSF